MIVLLNYCYFLYLCWMGLAFLIPGSLPGETVSYLRPCSRDQKTEAMRRAIVVFLTCAAGSQAFSAPALRVTSSRAGSAGALCTAMTSGASASRRGFLALAAGVHAVASWPRS